MAAMMPKKDEVVLDERDVAEEVACADDRDSPENGTCAAEELEADAVHAKCRLQ